MLLNVAPSSAQPFCDKRNYKRPNLVAFKKQRKTGLRNLPKNMPKFYKNHFRNENSTI